MASAEGAEELRHPLGGRGKGEREVCALREDLRPLDTESAADFIWGQS